MRGGRTEKRKIEPDTLYNSRLVHRLINRVMKSGQKQTAAAIV
jgi:ribosomal protein S7